MKEHPFFALNYDFKPYSYEHGLALLFFFIFGLSAILWARKQDTKTQDKLGLLISGVIFCTMLAWIAIRLYLREFDPLADFPLHLCNLIAILIPILAMTKSYVFYEILFFWTIAGTLQALITPDLFTAFPHYHFFKFFIVHAGLVIFILYATFVYGYRPTLKSVFKSYLALQLYALLVFSINSLVGSNYFYLNQKPPVASLLDAFGDWPFYILVVELLLIPLFLIIYLPFYMLDRFKK